MKPETRDNINLIATIIGVFMIPCGAAFLNSKLDTVSAVVTAHSDSNVAALKQSMTESYETQAAHKADIDKLNSLSATLFQGQRDLSSKVDENNVEQRLAIQHLGDIIQSSKPDQIQNNSK